MKRSAIILLAAALAVTAAAPASALFIFHPLVSSAVWGPHYAAYPPAVGYAPVAPVEPMIAPAPAVSVAVPVVGSYLRTLPNGCTSLTVNSVLYFRCGSVYYKPTFVGTVQMYEVVNNPG